VPERVPRVLLVLAESTGGIGRHVRTIAAGLADRGVPVTVCCPRVTAERLAFPPGVGVVALPTGGAVLPGSSARPRLRAALGACDVVHAHGLRAAAGCIRAGMGSRPLGPTWHNAPLGSPGRRLVHRALERYVARGSTVTLAASEDLAERARRAGGVTVRSSFVVAPGLAQPSEDRTALRAALGAQGRALVLAVGRLHPQKRFDVLIRAAARWADAPGRPVTVIAGDGPARPGLQRLIDDTGSPVQLLGERADVSDLLAAADAVVITSDWEARALVAQEAMRSGTPLVATAVGGLPELLGDAAVLVPAGSVDALVTATRRLLEDPGLRSELVRRGLDRARSWPTTEQGVDDLLHLYVDLRSSPCG
jgi:glycosyltransferase involved in cell wall biosynthesis